MNTQEQNKLIAEFMGFKQTRCMNGYAWDNNQIIKPISLHGNLVDTRDNGKFHTSWDWLTPVARKCQDSQIFGSQHLIDDINNALIRLEIDQLHGVIVQFIQWYNENRKQ